MAQDKNVFSRFRGWTAFLLASDTQTFVSHNTTLYAVIKSRSSLLTILITRRPLTLKHCQFKPSFVIRVRCTAPPLSLSTAPLAGGLDCISPSHLFTSFWTPVEFTPCHLSCTPELMAQSCLYNGSPLSHDHFHKQVKQRSAFLFVGTLHCLFYPFPIFQLHHIHA